MSAYWKINKEGVGIRMKDKIELKEIEKKFEDLNKRIDSIKRDSADLWEMISCYGDQK